MIDAVVTASRDSRPKIIMWNTVLVSSSSKSGLLRLFGLHVAYRRLI